MNFRASYTERLLMLLRKERWQQGAEALVIEKDYLWKGDKWAFTFFSDIDQAEQFCQNNQDVAYSLIYLRNACTVLSHAKEDASILIRSGEIIDLAGSIENITTI
ncbi:hypothetical protein [Olivibacter domesticus]|uniref:Uncharacterized protein n=1 Tax=Olivibacter domesticus TaxID=407022 RepID=A0A1H7I801_OLID1|nr:hypothetical protein [Olivibacter domesticus]SEK58649.1 hypothetical protein SAMN05661044_00615 [Olivibacter domesticus]